MLCLHPPRCGYLTGEKGTAEQEEQTLHEGSKHLKPWGGGELGHDQREENKKERRAGREQGWDAESSQSNNILQEEAARRSQAAQKPQSPIPDGGGPWH